MISISKAEITRRILAISAMHYRTSDSRPSILTPDSHKAIAELIGASWLETVSRLPGTITEWNENDDLITAETAGGYDEHRLRALLESTLLHLTLTHAYELSHPAIAVTHRREASALMGSLTKATGAMVSTIADGI